MWALQLFRMCITTTFRDSFETSRFHYCMLLFPDKTPTARHSPLYHTRTTVNMADTRRWALIYYRPTEGDGRLCFRRRWYVGRYIGICIGIYAYVCEELPGAKSSPIVTKLRQSYPWPQGTRRLNFGRSRSRSVGRYAPYWTPFQFIMNIVQKCT